MARSLQALMAGMHGHTGHARRKRLQRCNAGVDLRKVVFKARRLDKFAGPTFAAVHGVPSYELWPLRRVHDIRGGAWRVAWNVDREHRTIAENVDDAEFALSRLSELPCVK